MKFDIVRYVCLFTHGKKLNLRDTVVVGFSLYPKFVIYIYALPLSCRFPYVFSSFFLFFFRGLRH